MENRDKNRWGPGTIGIEGAPINVGGVNPWDFKWIRCNDPPVEMPHPSYHYQKHQMNVYKVVSGDREVTFAAGELSANVWGFYEKVS